MTAHPRITTSVTEYRRYENVPWTHRNLLCFMTEGPRETRHEWRAALYVHGFFGICATCEKPPIFKYYQCVSCDNFFIKDFTHHKYCILYPHCWNCIPKLGWDYCPDHTIPIYRSTADLEKIHPPLGLNPRTFSNDDLDDFAKEFGLEL